MRTRVLSFFLLPAVAGCPVLLAQIGTLDPTFNGNGQLRIDVDLRNDRALGLTVAANGDIITSGTTSSAEGSEVLLLRIASDGSPVAGFGDNGIVRTSFGPFNFGSGRAVLTDADNRILVAGQYAETVNDDEFVVLRYLPEGTPDNAFGSGGRVITSFAPTNDAANAMALQPDGRIVVAGFAPTGFAVARYLDNGDPDVSFSTDGKVITSFGTNGAVARAVAVQPDGRIIAAGYAPGQDNDAAVVRYMPDGALDTTFGDHGKVVTVLGANDDAINALALLPDGRFYAGGTGYSFTRMFALLRYMPNGALDTTFDHDGIVMLPLAPGPSAANAMVLGSDGKVVLAGTFDSALGADFALARFDSTGAFDQTFGYAGITFTDFDGRDDVAMAANMQSDGKLVLAGYSADSLYDVAVARYLGSSDIGFAEHSASAARARLLPNPFVDATTLRFTLDRTGPVTLLLLDALGRNVGTFLSAERTIAGPHDIALTMPAGLSSGSYGLLLITEDHRELVRAIVR